MNFDLAELYDSVTLANEQAIVPNLLKLNGVWYKSSSDGAQSVISDEDAEMFIFSHWLDMLPHSAALGRRPTDGKWVCFCYQTFDSKAHSKPICAVGEYLINRAKIKTDKLGYLSELVKEFIHKHKL